MSAETLIIPDTVHGAILLSLIDFFLSFVVISFIGFVLALFPYLNRTGKALQATPVAVSVMPERDVNAEHAAVIAAAIYSMIGRRRIVWQGCGHHTTVQHDLAGLVLRPTLVRQRQR